mmetsp:Transcript_23425/g.61333  ORF Transcript_23425/g.61333 Transcript_23425/m.61333 type:complete len:424 (+) Transcript_23425:47-1318(+)
MAAMPDASKAALFKKSKFKWKSASQVLSPQMASAAAGAGAGAAKPAVKPAKEPECGPQDDPYLPEPPQSSIQVLKWAPADYRLAAGCWDGSITIWEIGMEAGEKSIHRSPEQPKPFFTGDNFRCPGGVLDLEWHPDGLTLYAACTDGNVYGIFFDVGDVQPIGKHSAPVRTVNWCPQSDCLMSGSWDKTLQFWKRSDTVVDGSRHMSHGLVDCVSLPERVYGAAVYKDTAIVIVAGLCSDMLLYNVSAGQPVSLIRPVSQLLVSQPRCISVFGPKQGGYSVTESNPGFVVGGMDGRCAVYYLDPSLSSQHFSFKCHRGEGHAYAVNSAHFHPRHNSFATAGSDGHFVFWDKDSRSRVKEFSRIPSRGSITSAQFSGDGSMYAYSQSYDWAKGNDVAIQAGTIDCVRIHWTFLGQGDDECVKKR